MPRPEGPGPAPTTGPWRCADAARDRRDPLVATAAPARRWLLVENPGPWPFDAAASGAVPPDVLHELATAARGAHARLLMIRRPGRPARTGARRWAVLDTAPGTEPVWGRWRTEADLREAAERVAQPLATAVAPVRPTLLVCTHGRHDVCCAIRGRPVAAALAEHWPEETWECSHVGGDRFAANVVVLPSGATYGDLDPATAVRAVEAQLDGAVDPTHLRGFASEPPAGQAAVVAAHERYGPAGGDDVRYLGSVRTGDATWSVSVDVRTPGTTRQLVMSVVATRRPPARLTCHATAETPAVAYEVRDVAERRDPPS
ncbi:sucrase ferredoxin [Isoptericola sp. NPDC019693]|uniref:sucrase ferredoxin n=1 Tax=Isoptericola sp. NPDC019693 TaxID=3364009 RepID=UPI0037A75313